MPTKKNMFTRATAAIFATIALTACKTTGRDFLQSKTGIYIPKSISVCPSGVVDNERCEPNAFGGSSWQRNKNVEHFSIAPPTAGNADPDYYVRATRDHYIGSPFYNGNMQTTCKPKDPMPLIPENATILQEYDLAAMIKSKSVREVSSKLKSKLDAIGISASAEISNEFQAKLSQEIESKIQARFLWIVTKYPGGKTSIDRNPQLQACVKEIQDTNHQASLITGIAGYAILANKLDATVSSESAISNSLSLALQGKTTAGAAAKISAELGNEWKESVEKVAKTTITREDMSKVFYPLWVQFER